MKKKVGLVLLLIAAAGTVFAQKVGDTVRLQGQTQDYTVEQVSGDTLTLKKVPTLNGAWRRNDGGEVITISGSSGIITSSNATSALAKDAQNKGYLKVGDIHWRNITSTGNLTWSLQWKTYYYNTSKPDVATGLTWVNATITMSADGKTIASGDTVWTRQ